MGFYSRGLSGLLNQDLGSLTTSGANETARVPAPSGLVSALLNRYQLSEKSGTAEVWRPIGLWYEITTATTVTAPVVTLRKNGVSAATGGTATLVIAAASTTRIWVSFTDWTFAAADLANDNWSVLVTTTSTAGVVSVRLGYLQGAAPAVTEL